MTDRVDTVVVGAGIAGLTYAHARGPDADVHVLEASDRAGGLVQTLAHDGLHVELGPEALQDNAEQTLALLSELDLPVVAADAAARKRYVLTARAGLVPVPTGPGAFLRSPLLSPGAKLRALTEPWRAPGVALDGSIADFVRHRLGSAVLEALVDPAVSGIYAGDPERLSLRASFPTLATLVGEHGSLLKGLKAKARARRAAGQPRPPPPSLLTVAGGLERLPEALAARLGPRLRTGCAVASVGRAGDGWRVTLADGGTLEAARVVVATPARVAAAVLRQDEPALSQELGSMVSETVVSVAHAWRREDVSHPLDAFGYLVPSSLGRDHLGTLFSSSIAPDRCPPDRALLRTLLGGARRPELAELDDETLVARVQADVGAVLGLSGRPVWTHVTRWREVLPRYDLDQPARQDRIDALLEGRPGLSLVGNHRRGISVNALIETSRDLARRHAPA